MSTQNYPSSIHTGTCASPNSYWPPRTPNYISNASLCAIAPLPNTTAILTSCCLTAPIEIPMPEDCGYSAWSEFSYGGYCLIRGQTKYELVDCLKERGAKQGGNLVVCFMGPEGWDGGKELKGSEGVEDTKGNGTKVKGDGEKGDGKKGDAEQGAAVRIGRMGWAVWGLLTVSFVGFGSVL
ncbi:hypothetical protein GQ43DRAFT_442950 [Delitschia confertaspora ATCC 74209]|uniref:Uncharacterized protein n=1 Tax=Delitschia confertaspora ATCC 74209 TaxID=1513339 RepID=A0A9P4MWF0_9PLEO|nr:hypothetical protein GQ43DRAFT_442950 [Delitschia confertaspora ATCC 74209]